MIHRPFNRRVRAALAGVSVTALVGACGGGEVVALLQIVTPLAGSWSNTAGDETVSFQAVSPSDYLFQSKLNVIVQVSSKTGVCGDTVGAGVSTTGVLDNGKLSVHLTGETSACLTASFVDLRRIDAIPAGAVPALTYLNSRVDVGLDTGLWKSANNALILKFTQPSSVDNDSTAAVTGCDVSNTAAAVNFTGTMAGFNTTTLAKPLVPALVGTAITQVEFVDGATLKLLNGTQSVTLTRRADPANTSCPP